ncbi:WXG100 family type VII secretion target [Bacillus cereus]|nr:WXG100 family type VII secretion target [Bacillus cereus]
MFTFFSFYLIILIGKGRKKMVQIKVTPEMLEEVANRANNTRIALESIHNNLCNEIDQLCFQWIGASNQQFIQMFNDARPKAFTSINSLVKVEEDLKRIAEKFRNADNQDVTMEEGAMCGKPPEKSTIKKVWDGIVEGTGQAVEDTVEGFKALGKWETWENMGNAALHPIDTLSTMYNVLSDSFINDVINGDAESRAKWGSYALTQVGLGLIGDKGISKVTTLAKGASVAKFSEGISHFTNKLQMGDRFAYASVSEFRDIPKTSFNSLEDARNTFMFADPGNLNTPRFQEYLSQVEKITNRKIPENQRELLQEALEKNAYERLSKEEVDQRRAEFNTIKNKLIAEWEKETGQTWPTYTEEVISRRGKVSRRIDKPFDAHHFIENAHGGEHEWWNMHPAKYPDEHQGGIHAKDSISREIFKK